jgi:metal-dependent amidase/aminoacylase/carboxypeptidase family protein
MYTKAQRLSDTLVDLRRQVHRHPELGFQEHHTARLIAEHL